MGDQFNIRSPKARALAVELAARKNMTLAQIVEYALEQVQAQEVATQSANHAQKDIAWKRIRANASEAGHLARANGSKLSSNHDELYNDDGSFA